MNEKLIYSLLRLYIIKNNNTEKNFRKRFMKVGFLKFLKILDYSKSLRFGFRDGSPERSPKINKETKKITVV